MTTPDGVRITGVEAGIENAAILARFTLGGRPVDPQWQGAFGRALDGKLDAIAARWRIDRRGIAVTRVEPDAAARVAKAVSEAVDAANEYVADILDAAEADRDAFSRHETALHLEVETAQAAMREQLGMSDAGDSAAAARFDDESPASRDAPARPARQAGGSVGLRVVRGDAATDASGANGARRAGEGSTAGPR
jgi:hypothetical protein